MKMQNELWKSVPPMRGAADLVRGLASVIPLIDLSSFNSGFVELMKVIE